MSNPKPGFYDDGTNTGTERYWDGRRWTKRTRVSKQTHAAVAPVASRRAADRAVSTPTAVLASASDTRPTRRKMNRPALLGLAVAAAFFIGIAVGHAGGGAGTTKASVIGSPAVVKAVAAESSEPTSTAPAPSMTPSQEPGAASYPEPSKTEEVSLTDQTTKHGVTWADARLTCEHHGKAAAPWGFEDHNILGVINEEISHNRWFIKHEVTVTNAFGTKRDTVFECTVGGTHTSPVVRSFYVYD